MKNLKLLMGVAMLTCGVSASAQAFSKGDVVADLNIGFGVDKTTNLKYSEKDEVYLTDKATKGSFTQRLGVEFGIYNINKKSSLGLGFSFLNGVAFTEMTATGTYNYQYEVTTYEKGNRNTWWAKYTDRRERSGSGTANASANLVDFTAMLRLAYHYSFSDKLDTYAGIGFGVSRMTTIFHDFYDMNGFGQDSKDLDYNYKWDTQRVYSYNDLDHVEWSNGGSEGRFAAAIFLGARYYVTNNIGIQAELGLPNITFRKDFNNYSLFSLGGSYKF